MKRLNITLLLFAILLVISFEATSQGFNGYYRYPDIHGSTIVFTAEGDLWKVNAQGGVATRLTTHQGEELYPKISPDGQTIAYVASYEGSPQLYTIPIDGGIPERWTFDNDFQYPNSWTSDGKLIYSTRHYTTCLLYTSDAADD